MASKQLKTYESLFLEFLKQCRVGKNELYTHVTKKSENNWISGKYFIPNKYIPHFRKLYCNLVYKNPNFIVKATLAEKPESFFPLRVDFDFKTKIEHEKFSRQYTLESLKTIVKIYQEEIRNAILPDVYEDKNVWCMILEKPKPRIENEFVSDGFHLHFPFFICDTWTMDSYLRNQVNKRLSEISFWKSFVFDNHPDSLIDTNMATKNWMMFGSMNYKNSGTTGYTYSNFDFVPVENRLGYCFDHHQRVLNLEKFFQDEKKNFTTSIRYNLPILLSIRGFKNPCVLNSSVEKARVMSRPKIRKQIGTNASKRSMDEILEDLKTIRDGNIMEMISDERAERYDTWRDVGFALYNIGQGDMTFYDLFVDFSRRGGSKFDEAGCEKIWNSYAYCGVGLGYLLSMAKADNPQEYNSWKRQNISAALWYSVKVRKPSEKRIAQVFLKKYGDRFLCAWKKHDVWYDFRNHRWHLVDDADKIQQKITIDLCEEYWTFQKEISEKIAESKQEERKRYEIYRENCIRIAEELEKVHYVSRVLKMCKILCNTYPNFMAKRDENRMLLGCENGVLDLDQCIFRDGRPDDMITFSTGIEYKVFSYEDDEIVELMDFLEKVFPREDLRNYFLDVAASCLQGGNRQKLFLIATGDGDNGKSVTFKLLEYVFGTGETGYFGKFPRELLVKSTSSNSSSGPRPEMARVRGKRIMGSQEVTKMEKLNIGFIKEATGNDSYYSRGLYEKGTEINPMFTFWNQCNEPPEIPGQDEATWNRMRFIDFQAKFVKPGSKIKVPETIEEQKKAKIFPADLNFSDKLPEMAQAMLWLLFETYKKYKKRGSKIYTPNIVIQSTEFYKNQNDVYGTFIADFIEKIDDTTKAKQEYITFQSVWEKFDPWYKQVYSTGSKDRILKHKLKNEISKRLGCLSSTNKIYGLNEKSRFMGYTWKPEPEKEKETNFVEAKETV